MNLSQKVLVVLCEGLFVFVFIFFAYAAALPAVSARAQIGDAAITKEELRNQLQDVQNQITELENGIEGAKADQKSLTREISILNKEMEKQKLQIREIDLNLREIAQEIKEKNGEIGGLENKLKEKKMLLAASLQELNKYDGVNWVGALFFGGNLSDLFNHVRGLQNIQRDVNEFIMHIDDIRKDLESDRSDLEDKKDDMVRLKNLSTLQKQTLEKKQSEKSTLLEQTKGQEKLFQEGLKKSKKDAVMIRQQLFTLESVGVSMSLGEAIEKALFTGQKTGVRPAFLLAIFQVESRLGTYVGGGSWRKDMKPAERPIFLQLTQKLGLDPDTMPVSKHPYYGWGGAMGAAQFIPSTWSAYEHQVAALTGHNPPSPWSIEDAFIASGLKLVGNGAGSHAYKDEHTAAAKYLGGGNYKKRVSQIYANNVMDWAEYYQGQIDVLEGIGARSGGANSL
ncbi:lytic murein transglycosylase [Candidatus Azambacteria bacterium]|nr:lytic murein transglycosylase [Candidatus Azambacteria bacterium]